jgi:hypothetical protein
VDRANSTIKVCKLAFDTSSFASCGWTWRLFLQGSPVATSSARAAQLVLLLAFCWWDPVSAHGVDTSTPWACAWRGLSRAQEMAGISLDVAAGANARGSAKCRLVPAHVDLHEVPLILSPLRRYIKLGAEGACMFVSEVRSYQCA